MSRLALGLCFDLDRPATRRIHWQRPSLVHDQFYLHRKTRYFSLPKRAANASQAPAPRRKFQTALSDHLKRQNNQQQKSPHGLLTTLIRILSVIARTTTDLIKFCPVYL